jgi:predicted TPR repeat methyltransferase
MHNNLDIAEIYALHQAGELDQAKAGYLAILHNTTSHYPEYIAALNNLGTICYAQGKFDEAISYYHQAIDKQANYVDAYYNLGLALTKKNLFTDAINTYQKLLQYAPEHFAARFHLACVFMQQDKISDATKEFLLIEAAQPYHFETQSNLATCFLKQGAFNEARDRYQNALTIHPDDTQILFNLGYINMQQGYLDAAIQYYQRAVRANPNLFEAHNNLGVAFLAKQHPAFALHHFQEALCLQPDNKAVEYTIKMLEQNQHLLAAPPDYIQALFDSYADHYESHLRDALDYKIPELFTQAITKIAVPNKSLAILDLGCGTGLCGLAFKGYASTLVGVDLSEKMLEIAKQKNIYDSLIASDITHFLADKVGQYDLVIAGDVLVYTGDLEAIFHSVNRALKSSGLWIFNTEISDSTEFQMNQSGRFSHHQSYIEKLATKHSFTIRLYNQIITRLQNNAPVYGHLYILQKPH